MTADLALLIGIIVLLIVASAFFSSAETALTAASDARMRQLASKGNRRARLVERLRDDREGLIGSILIGNNAVNVIASALATSLFISLFDEAGVLWATIVMTIVLVVFAEVMPKTYALTYSDKYALAIAPPIRAVVLILSPLSVGLRMLANRLIGKRHWPRLHPHQLGLAGQRLHLNVACSAGLWRRVCHQLFGVIIQPTCRKETF